MTQSRAQPEPSEETCARLEIRGSQAQVIYVKGNWFPTHFSLYITEGLHAWLCNASEKIVSDRASQWDQTVSEYLEAAKHYLGHQQPGSVYSFEETGDGSMKLSWTLEKEGTKLECRWKCDKAESNQKVICTVLDFLMDANTRQSEEVVRKTRSFERMKIEAEKCLAQSETLRNQKIEFENDIYAKFVAVLNSKKAKLRELREKCMRLEPANTKEDEADDFSGEDTGNETEDENEQSSTSPTLSGSKNSANTNTSQKGLKSKEAVEDNIKTKLNSNSEEETQKLNKPKAKDVKDAMDDKELISNPQGEETSPSAARLLAAPKYTTAPKKRRRG
eukprot:TRINITY_DN31066_c0_g1_i1.p1 TRINITY_DN31066_c0_g1~~TRINITY_DN31066_c0_g1_i1.p1  ORF type:complete len:333 (-),score=81.55 TRINITY_DN31066_c0_g1_i1:98-1096(-)